MNRLQLLKQVTETPHWDVIIIGGGATGLGIALDSATRGFRTLLLEASDFAKGTSSRSTKLVHGGVRYLEQGDVPLVLEALHERGLMHQNAPHLVHHLSFIVPRYKWWEGPFFGIGLKVYDALAGKLNLAPSRLLSRDETIAHIPNIEQNHLLGGVEYFDGQFDDARFAITLARTAVHHGACVLNYCPVQSITKTQGFISGVQFSDQETGCSYTVTGSVVINATGIFSDAIRRMDNALAPSTIQPSQGVHLVFDRSFLQGDSAIMVPHTDDGRVLFVIPWHGKVLVGTTDTPMETPEIEPRALPDEIGFILRNAARYLARDPQEKDILSVFAGQRPLVRPPGNDGAPTKNISRNHEIFVSDSGLITVTGGKWTTYRKMAQDTMDKAIMLAGLKDHACVTTHLPLLGWQSQDTLSVDDFLSVYGSETADIQSLILADPSLGQPIHPLVPYPMATVVWAARHEQARTLEDVLSRRTRILLLNAQAAIEAAPAVANLLSKELGHDENWTQQQIATFTQIARGYLHVS